MNKRVRLASAETWRGFTVAPEHRWAPYDRKRDYPWRAVKGHLFDVTGGAIERVRRIGAVRNCGWELTVAPDGEADVGLTLRATTSCTGAHHVCTADGRMLEGGVQMTIAGPAAFSVADAQVDEAEGATLGFTVTLSRARNTVTSVAYATSDGTAVAGSDYTASSGTLTFAALETTKTVSVPVLDDAHDEGAETMKLTLANASGARIADDSATGAIKNSDHMSRAWMLRFGRAVGAQVVDALGARFAGANASHITLGGLRFDPDTVLSHSVDSETPRAHPVANPNAALSDTARAQQPVDAFHRVVGAVLRPVGVLLRFQVRLNDRHQHKQRRCLRHPVPYARNPQWPVLPRLFLRDQYLAHRLRCVGPVLQLPRQFPKPTPHAVCFDILESLPVHPGRAAVAANLPPGVH